MTRARRGFAAMDPAKQRQIASLGGKAAHARGKAHRFSSEEARAAGRKGGLAGTGPRKPKEAVTRENDEAPAPDHAGVEGRE